MPRKVISLTEEMKKSDSSSDSNDGEKVKMLVTKWNGGALT